MKLDFYSTRKKTADFYQLNKCMLLSAARNKMIDEE